MILHEPIRDREPFFTGWETDQATYETACPHCRERISVVFKEMLTAAWGWKDKMEQELKESLAEIFRINLADNSIGMGMPGVVARSCSECGKSSYFYFHFRETSNSVYSISLRAAATDEPTQAEQDGAGQPATRPESK